MFIPDLIHKTITTIKKHSMLAGGEKILIGLSGGPDSVCLLHVLSHIREKFKLDLRAIYIDHGLRPGETEKEIEFCKDICERLSVQCITKSIDLKSHIKTQRMNIQEAARQFRYRIYEETAHETGSDKIALGHTADDQAETLLMRLVRGSGPTGLSGIPPVRKHFIRPLIDIERKEIEKFLGAGKLEYMIDSSNLKKDYLRNKMRLSFIPKLKEFNPHIIETLSRTAAIFRDEERYFDILVTKTLMKLISRKTASRIELFLAPLESMDKVLMRRVLRRAIDATNGLREINFIHIEDIIELVKYRKPGDRLYLPKGIRVIKDYSTIILTSDPPVTLHACTLSIPGETILKEAGVLIKAFMAEGQDLAMNSHKLGIWINFGIFDADRMHLPLVARSRKDGDFFYPSGFGRRRKLQDFFVDLKVPRDERNRVPLIISGDDIIWVVGYRGDERFRVTGETVNAVKLEVKKIRD